MQPYFGAFAILVLAGIAITRIAMLKKRGIRAMRFGETDKSDFLIPPFVLFYFYTVFAHTFGLWTPGGPAFANMPLIAWAGVFACISGLAVFYWSLISFGDSFRVGIDDKSPAKLITTGVYEVTRNPIYLAFGLFVLGQFLIFPNLVTLIFMVCFGALAHRQVLREERFLRLHYGQFFEDYCGRVRRYL